MDLRKRDMAMKTTQNAVDLRKAVGEIDTSVPFQSVKAAVNLFGEGSFVAAKPFLPKKKSPPPISERIPERGTDLHLTLNELNKYKEQLKNSETTRAQAIAELDVAKKIVADLTSKLNSINESKEMTVKAIKIAKSETANIAAWQHELDGVREQYAFAFSEIDAAKQDLRRLQSDFKKSIEAKISAIHQEVEAKKSNSNEDKVFQLGTEIAAVQGSLRSAKVVPVKDKQQISEVLSEKNASKSFYKHGLEQTRDKLASLKKEFVPKFNHSVETELSRTMAEIGAIQKEIEQNQTLKMESPITVTKGLDGAIEVLQKVAEEDILLRRLLDSLKLELEAAKKEHTEMKNKESEIESTAGDLNVKIYNCKAEIEAAMTVQSNASSAHDDMLLTLNQLSLESEEARKESEALTEKANELRNEAKLSQISLNEMEKKLQFVIVDAEKAKIAEAKALDQFKAVSEKANEARISTLESGASITISREEYDNLSQKVEDCEKLVEVKVEAAKIQVKAAKASENIAIKKLEAGRKKMEDIEMAIEEALKRAETAEAAKKALEVELKRWCEQDKATDSGSLKSMESLLNFPNAKPQQATEGSQGIDRSLSLKKKSGLKCSGVLRRKKSQADSEFASYLPGEKPA